jgi:molybdenum cofactor guanylyltransferase
VSTAPRVAAVVLAGGSSRRFGSDKLDAPVDGVPLVDRALSGLPDDVDVIVVGPPRRVGRPVRFVREDPPGGGPAAALVTGIRAALEGEAEQIVVLPGDAPAAGQAAVQLLSVLLRSPAATAVVGTDPTGFEQPLQLALTRSAARQLLAAAGPDGARGGSARALVARLDPPALREVLSARAHWDVDTQEQLRAWEQRDSAAVAAVLSAATARAVSERPVVVALDGRSGSGKSTLASALALSRAVTVVHGDDFYSSSLTRLDPQAVDQLSDDQLAERVFDWRRLRTDALAPLAAGHMAEFAPYDWRAQDGRLARTVRLPPSPIVVVEGVYSARPELADLVDVTVLVEVDPELRRLRLVTRADAPDWQRRWERAENWYFAEVRPPSAFDVRVSSTDG